jgi:predicted nicotinamide N-methyase
MASAVRRSHDQSPPSDSDKDQQNCPSLLEKRTQIIRSFKCFDRTVELVQQHENKALEWTGGVVWACAELLTRYIERCVGKSWFGKRVLELGGGLGLVSITSAIAGAHVTCTDGNIDLMTLLQGNIVRNSAVFEHGNGSISVLPYRWGDDPLAAGLKPPYDIIVGADILFEPESFKPLAESLQALCTSTTRVILCYEVRNNMDLFFALLDGRFTSRFIDTTDLDGMDESDIVKCRRRIVILTPIIKSDGVDEMNDSNTTTISNDSSKAQLFESDESTFGKHAGSPDEYHRFERGLNPAALAIAREASATAAAAAAAAASSLSSDTTQLARAPPHAGVQHRKRRTRIDTDSDEEDDDHDDENLDNAHNSEQDTSTAAVEAAESNPGTALVPYTHVNPYIAPFSQKKRSFTFLGKTVVIKQAHESKDAGTGGAVWDGAIVFSYYVQNFVGDKWQGKRVIELGSGLGLVSIVCALAGADVLATEGDSLLLPTLKYNITQNTDRHEHEIDLEQYWWGDDISMSKIDPPYDIIVASDIIYKEATFKPLVKALVALADEHTLVVLAYKIRYATQHSFFTMIGEHFDVEQLSDDVVHPDFRELSDVHFAHLCKKKQSS